MIISRTPFRISFFGGGTDYPAWYKEHGGAALATTINKYCYITCRWLPPFFKHKSRIVWSHIERVRNHADIQHPAVREVLAYLKPPHGIELHHDGDLPARTGLGSSSAFTVGLLHAIYGLTGIMPSKMQLAREAIYIEQERLAEHVGCQDQLAAALGGFNRMDFARDGGMNASPILMDKERLKRLQQHLLLIFTGLSRTASDVAAAQIRAMPNNRQPMRNIHAMVDRAMTILQGREDLVVFGRLLHEAWQLKRRLTSKISTPAIDQMYETARRAGAIGGKLLGAGGGGFLLLFAPPERHASIVAALGNLLHVPIEFETMGSRIIFVDPDGYDPGLLRASTTARPGLASRAAVAP